MEKDNRNRDDNRVLMCHSIENPVVINLWGLLDGRQSGDQKVRLELMSG